MWLERGRLIAVSVTPGRTLSKQSLRGQVSVKLTPEICINDASSNSRLTAAGRWATASDSHSQNCLQTIFFFFSLPLMRQQSNYTCMLKNLLKLYWIWTWDTLWVFCCCCSVLFVLFCFQFFSLLMRQWQNYFWDTISRIGSWGANTKIIKTETLLHLNLEIFFIYLLFLLFFILYFRSSHYLSNACLAYCWLVHYLSLFISLKLFLFVLFFSTCLFICFSLFL
jgi:hypothetical protein